MELERKSITWYVRWWRDQLLKLKPAPCRAHTIQHLDMLADSIERGEHEKERKEEVEGEAGRPVGL